MTEREYLIASYSFVSFGPERIRLLEEHFGSYGNIWKAKKSQLIKTGLNKRLVEEFEGYRKRFNAKKFFNRLDGQGIKTVTVADGNYPANLKGLMDAPCVLFYRGGLKDSDEKSVAIVGSRKMSMYGREVTDRFAKELAGSGITIVSGLAFGVDTQAHKSALAVEGRCIAVLASGVDNITPRTNEWIGTSIIDSGGAVVSEYPPGTQPQRAFFPYRNRIISGLSKAVVIVEGMI
ncbi:MAG: DNA-processing protein DprA, partial [Candidatus Woesebacteria bacterium]